ncbi:ferredoxin reductase [Mycolicibacterium sp.]|uniref:ferredoxin reductase n=1 Tax=Mycolicibacterium sp. TaxID=2320850 RepID=UPI0028AF3F74|nr:ferredoxin reductase [Mycolicibacterium sp.]
MTTTAPAARGLALGRLRAGMGRLVRRVTTPLLPGDYLDTIDPLLAGTPLRGRIVGVHPETRDAVTLVITPGRGWRRHVPGQYLRLGVDVDGVRHWRSYSITSRAERADGSVSITVKAVPGGVVSEHLVRRAVIGDIVHLDLPAGDFTLDTPMPEKILFVTAGSGITPVMGILRNLLANGRTDIVMVHSAPAADEVVFGGELRMLARRGRIRLAEIHTRTDGRLDLARLSQLVADLDERHAWACGPAGLLEMVENHWESTGIGERLHTERFRPTLVATGDGGTVRFAATGATVDTDGSQSLLDAGEAAGVLMPSGCRMGICFGCVAPLRRGAVRDLRSGELTVAAEGNSVIVQTCISGAAGDCDIDL